MAGALDLGGLSVRELGKRVYDEIWDDGVLDAAAQLAYYFMLALFPLMIFLISLLSAVRAVNIVDSFMKTLAEVMPAQAYELIGHQLNEIMNSPSGGVLTFGALGTLWAASSGVAALLGSLNRAYDVEETRGFVKVRAIAVGLTIALAALIICGAVLLMSGDKISGWVAETTGIAWLSVGGTIVNYLLGVALMVVGLQVAYYFGPDVKDQKWSWITPGSIVGALLFVLSSIGFSLYIRFSDSYTATYGSLGAVIVLMLWLYLLGLALTIGGEVNAEIAHAAEAKGNPEAPADAASNANATGDSNAAPAGGTSKSLSAGTPKPASAAKTEPKPYAAPLSLDPPAAVVDWKNPSESDPEASPALVVETAIGDLIETLKSENGQVRAGAVAALRNTAPETGMVLAVLRTSIEDEHPEVRKQAIRTLATRGAYGVDVLARALVHPDRETRRLAAEALGELGPVASAARPALDEAIREAEVYRAAVAALGKIDPSGAPDSETRTSAA